MQLPADSRLTLGCLFLREQSRKRLRINYFEERQTARAPAGEVRQEGRRPTPLAFLLHLRERPSPTFIHQATATDVGKFPFDLRPLVAFPAEIRFQRIAGTRSYGVGHPRAVLKHPFPTPP